ncbi:hypothetical protein CBR_g22084 [Chara braunii]|uniref:O-fucosyltransferase family protein n=1 Tax=Chara braunii TaxID=69332 RepID=A0A388L208_CHABU|nr:hypothetical protein CBR_g22084 [Chara braunii]|eukprot:GBG76337.1 hypothetical protein CBR_g22084 [Chara braunii]
MENDTDVTSLSSPWWLHPKKGKELKPCLDMPPWHEPPSAASNNGYIYIVVNGGLNQQRASICNAVTVARFLNATLVIPYFHYNAIWKDSSTFEELFDMEHFINSLKNDVNVVTSPPEQLVKALPEAVQGSEGPETLGYKVKILGRSPISAYLDEALPALKQYKVIRFSPYAKRLNNDGIPLELQRLRCKANFEAIRFAKPIRDMADILMERLLSGEYSPEGMRHPVQKYVSVHLRFEKDMVAFSNCLYTGKRKEKQDLAAYREYGWRGKFTRKGRVPLDPGKVRREGRCPLTPLEVGLVLRGMGFPKSTRIYIASGKIYGGEKTMQPLREMFPDILTKEMLLASEELAPFRSFSSRLAALDYTVCLHSEAFFVTQGGNFGEVLMGHRRFLNQGHAKTIKPDKKVLSALLDCPDITWDKFRQAMRIMRKDNDAKGAASRRIKDSIFAFPSPECMCPATYDAAAAAAAGLYKTAESLQPGSGGGEVSIDVGAIFPLWWYISLSVGRNRHGSGGQTAKMSASGGSVRSGVDQGAQRFHPSASVSGADNLGVNAVVMGLFVVVVAVLAVYNFGGLHEVPEGHVGVYRRGGAVLRTISEPGFHLMMPGLTTFERVQVTLQTDEVTNIPCGTKGGVMIVFEKIEVVNRLRKEHVLDTIMQYGAKYDKIWIYDKIHHEINQFCSMHTLQEVYIDKFDQVDERMREAIQRDCTKYAPGIEIINVRVTKPKIPLSIARNYEQMEEERTKALIAAERQRVVEKETETERKKAVMEAEKVAQTSRIRMEQMLAEKESQKRQQEIENEIYLSRQKSLTDAEYYRVMKEAEANKLKLTPQFLEWEFILAIANNSKIFFGEKVPHMVMDQRLLGNFLQGRGAQQ